MAPRLTWTTRTTLALRSTVKKTSPHGDLAVLVLHIEMKIHVRIDPLDLRDHAFQRDLLAPIEDPADGVVRQCLGPRAYPVCFLVYLLGRSEDDRR